MTNKNKPRGILNIKNKSILGNKETQRAAGSPAKIEVKLYQKPKIASKFFY